MLLPWIFPRPRPRLLFRSQRRPRRRERKLSSTAEPVEATAL